MKDLQKMLFVYLFLNVDLNIKYCLKMALFLLYLFIIYIIFAGDYVGISDVEYA